MLKWQLPKLWQGFKLCIFNLTQLNSFANCLFLIYGVALINYVEFLNVNPFSSCVGFFQIIIKNK